MGLLLLLFVAVPIAEIWILIVIGGHVGFWPTIGGVLAVGALGAWLARREGTRVLAGIQRAQAEGRVPEEGLLSGALVLAGGVLLITPGVLTDVAGLVLLVPWTRRLVARRLRRWFEKKIQQGVVHVHVMGTPPDPLDDVIDVEPVDEKRDPRP